jgi:hypothetical protein
MEDVLAVYTRPRDPDCPLVCLDESSKQLLAETRVPIPMKPGRPARCDYEYERNGTANLFMMFAPLEGWRRVKVTDRHTGRCTRSSPDEIATCRSPDAAGWPAIFRQSAEIDVDGENVPSTLTMTGREYHLIRKEEGAADAAVLAALPTLVARGTLALPSFIGDDGLFPGAAHRGRIIGPAPETPAEWQGLAVLYAAFSANRCLDALGSSKRIVIDGGFAANLPFARCLAALRPSQEVSVSQSRDGTALGAALLWRRFTRTLPVSSVVLEAVTPLGEAGFDRPGLSAAYQSWIAFSEHAP